MAVADYFDTVQKVYIAFYQRPADPAGLYYWSQRVNAENGNLSAVIDAFANSAEATRLFFPDAAEGETLYDLLTEENIGGVIDAIYLALFNRAPDEAGKQFYVDGFADGTFTAGNIMLNILNGAQGDDAVAVANKLEVANLFTTALDPEQDGIGPFQATYNAADEQAARDWLATVTSDPATRKTESEVVTDIQAAIADSGDAILGQTSGQTFTLTNNADTVNVTTLDTVDTVKGIYFSDPTKDTFSFGDDITGNGKTVVEIVVADATTGTAPYASMSGVDKLSIIAGDATAIFTMDAGTYGTDISTVSLSGVDNFVLDVNDLEVTGPLTLEVVAAADSDLDVSGKIDGLDFSITAANSDTDAVGVTATVGTVGIDVVLGENDTIDITVSQASSKTGAASVGDVTIGDIVVAAGEDATASIAFSNDADSTTKGAATAGSITLGSVNLDIGVSASVSMDVYNSATAASGAATVGNITVGDIDVAVAKSGSQDGFDIVNNADSTKGNATAGNVTIGNINVVAEDSASYALYLSVTNMADAGTSGNATVGNIVVGDVNITGGDDFSWARASLSNSAYADKGAATAGDITIGNVTLDIGNSGSGSVSLELSNLASVAISGAATVGDITVGNIVMNAGTDNSHSVDINASASTAKGAATVGNVVIGDISGEAGVDASLSVEIDLTANGTAGDSIGNISVGNIDFYGQPTASLTFSLEADSDTGTVGAVTLGNASMAVDGSGYVSYYVDVESKTGVGAVQIGDLNMTLGSSASLYYFSVDVSASAGDIASFTVGDITIDAATLVSDSSADWDVSANDDLGDVTIGNVTINAAKSAALDDFSMEFDAVTGNIGNVTLGNTVITAGVNANVTHYFDFTADNEIGDINVGDVSLSAAKSGSIWLSHSYSASDDIGDIKYGNITVAAAGDSADAGFSMNAYANGNTIGSVTIGDIDLSASGDSASATVSLWFNDTGDTVGAVTVGDINLTVSNTASAAAGAYVSVSLESNGDVSVGDIAVTAGDVTADFATAAAASADVTLASNKNITVGNITVVGGQANDGPDNTVGTVDDVVLDSLANLTGWLSLADGDGAGTTYKVTVGNVDYSGYEAAATIDVSGFSGAGTIRAAQDDTDITLNSGKNLVYLGAGDDTVDVKTGGTLKASADVIDAIFNFTTGKDVIEIDTSAAQGAFVFVSGDAGSYDAFLTAATSNISVDGTDIYARKVGSDVFVAVDKDDGGAIDFVIKLAGVASVQAADFSAY